MSEPESLRAKVARRCRAQADGCRRFGSVLYGELLTRAGDDIDAGGPVWDVVEPYAADPGGTALALRLMGATHRLALTGAAPALAAHYPSTGGDGDVEGAWAAWSGLVRDQPERVQPLVALGLQTNEVARCASLLGGFLEVARTTGLPLRVLEVGTSAGLNLRWDHYRYGERWGPADATVDLGDVWEDPAPPLEPDTVEVVERRGCDVAPVDPTSEDGRLSLLSFVWPDQAARFHRLDAACALAATVPVSVDRASGDQWVKERLAEDADGVATVVFHSIMLQYMTPEVRAGLTQALEEAGAAATPRRPLARLSLEPRDTLVSDIVVRLRRWPGGDERVAAVSHPHGAWVRWGAS